MTRASVCRAKNEIGDAVRNHSSSSTRSAVDSFVEGARVGLETGQIVDGKYRVVRLIGEGGMGTVYEGLNTRIGRRVAIKVLHADVATQPEFVERFEREARAAARIGSAHVCHVYDLGDLPSGDRYLVMEYLDGVSFEERITSRGRLTTTQLAPIAFELLEGLATMHEARVIHRDLKPANVFLARASTPRGEIVKILDFGVAKMLPIEGEGGVGTKTTVGLMIGTPLYMSPEQARGAQEIDARTDLYAASVMFYQALTGETPYMANSLNELLFKIALESPKPLRERQPDVDEAFAAIVHKGLARDPNERFSSARSYQEAIAAWGKKQGRPSLSFALPSERTEPTERPPPMPPLPDLGLDDDPSSVPAPRASEPKLGQAEVPAALSKSAPTAWSGAKPVSRPSLTAEAGSLPPVTDEVEGHASKRPSPSQPAKLGPAGWPNKQRLRVTMIGAVGALALTALVGFALSDRTPSSQQAVGSASGADMNDARPAIDLTPSATEAQLAVPLGTVDAAATAAPGATDTPPHAPPTTGTPLAPVTATAQTSPTPPADPGRPPPVKKASAPPPRASTTPTAGAVASVAPPPPPPPAPHPPPASSVRNFRRSLD